MLQAPSWPGTAQLWQVGHVEEPQQTPSVHALLRHWLLLLQDSPLDLRAPQLPAVQMLPLLQSPSLPQLVRQPVAVQVNGAHPIALGIWQVPLPLPLQVAAGWKVEVVALQLAAPHSVLLEASWQAPPWQRPVFPQVPEVVQRLCGSAVPLTTVAQVPAPLMLHAWQVPQLAVEQQTLSTQLPEVQSCAAVQATPGAFFIWHWPPGLGQK